MKTAEEWVNQFKTDGDGDFTHSEEIDYMLNFIRRIQADALFHASSLLNSKAGEQMMGTSTPNCSGTLAEIAHKIETKAIALNNT